MSTDKLILQQQERIIELKKALSTVKQEVPVIPGADTVCILKDRIAEAEMKIQVLRKQGSTKS